MPVETPKVTSFYLNLFVPQSPCRCNDNTVCVSQTDLLKLDIQLDWHTDFDGWKAQWTLYATLSGLIRESAGTKVQVLSLCQLRETLAIINNLGLTKEQMEDAGIIITAIKHHLDDWLNESIERRNLCQKLQWFLGHSLRTNKDLQILFGAMHVQEYTRPNHQGNTRWRHGGIAPQATWSNTKCSHHYMQGTWSCKGTT